MTHPVVYDHAARLFDERGNYESSALHNLVVVILWPAALAAYGLNLAPKPKWKS
jgi:hypothetical protein